MKLQKDIKPTFFIEKTSCDQLKILFLDRRGNPSSVPFILPKHAQHKNVKISNWRSIRYEGVQLRSTRMKTNTANKAPTTDENVATQRTP